VTAPHKAASVVARSASADSTVVVASSTPAIIAQPGSRNAIAPHAQAAAASIAPSTDGIR
jgi:hypothetical protein